MVVSANCLVVVMFDSYPYSIFRTPVNARVPYGLCKSCNDTDMCGSSPRMIRSQTVKNLALYPA